MHCRLKILFIVYLFCTGSISAQDINFSQFYELPLLRNPALAGIYKGDLRVTSAFRNQWQTVPTIYQTQALGIEFKMTPGRNTDDFLSLGLQLTNDVAGDSKLGKTQFLPTLTYHKYIGGTRNTYLSAGFIAGGVSQRFNPLALKFDDQFVNGAYSPLNPTFEIFNQTTINYLDVSAGISLSSDFGYNHKFYIGAAYFHLNQPRVAFSSSQDIRLNKKIVFNAGLSLATSESHTLILYGDYFAQGGRSQLQGGIIYRHNIQEYENEENLALSIGGLYRWNDAIIPMVKLDYYKWALGLTYDVNISPLRTATQFRGGFELTLSLKSFLNIRNSSLEKVRCVVDF